MFYYTTVPRDLLLKKDFGVSTVMLLRKPLLTVKVVLPPYDRIAEAPSITEPMSDPSFLGLSL